MKNVEPKFNQSPKYLPVVSENKIKILHFGKNYLLRKTIECKIVWSTYKIITNLVSNECI